MEEVTRALRELGTRGQLPELARQATADIAAVHRRPVSLRRCDVTGSESVVRGARLSALIDGAAPNLSAAPEGPLGQAISAYAVLAPGRIEATARTLRRAPAQVLARVAVAAGGDGRPAGPQAAARLQGLGRLIGAALDTDAAILTQVVHLEIAGRALFGPASGLVARVASRVVAVAGGFDPRGLAVPETALHRGSSAYRAALAAWGGTDEAVDEPLPPEESVAFLLRAWIAGAAEAEAIAAAAG